MENGSTFTYSVITDFTENLNNYVNFRKPVPQGCYIDLSKTNCLISVFQNDIDKNIIIIYLNGIFPGDIFLTGLPKNKNQSILLIKFVRRGTIRSRKNFNINDDDMVHIADKFISVTLDNIENIEAYAGDIVPINFLHEKNIWFNDGVFFKPKKMFSCMLLRGLKEVYGIGDISRDDFYIKQYRVKR